jgi:phospholipid/cholesterol/gamma-HCH transport system substrate-binding protein
VIGRVAAMAAVAVALIAVVVIVLSSGSTYQVRAIFQDASQIVSGDQVQVAGNPIGTVSNISLTADGEAQLTLDITNALYDPLRQGTEATVRHASLSGIANRYVDLRLGGANESSIPDNGVIGTQGTTSAVDLDRLFNTLDAPTRKGLQDLFQGSASQYSGQGQIAQRAWE